MSEEVVKPTEGVLDESDAAAHRKGGFADSWLHAVLASLSTRRWSRVFGYGALLVACRVVRGIIQA